MGHVDGTHHGGPQGVVEEPLSADEREAIVRDVISTQRLAGIDMDYNTVAGIIDEVFAEPVPTIE